jgi:anhydro-N-acetylmuramic acid kinase
VPLAALPDYLLFGHETEGRILVHLGGLARMVFLPGGRRLREVVGFEVGPCNLFLDSLMRQLTGGREAFDPGGKNAVQGRCEESLLKTWLAHPYLQRRPPKSFPRQAFETDFAARVVRQARDAGVAPRDLLCTATHFVARTITEALRRFAPPGKRFARLLLCGGGVRNGLLWHLLSQGLPHLHLQKTDAAGMPAEARKAVSFALLAALTLDGVPANLPSATGAAGSRLLGSLTPGSSLNWAHCLMWMAAQVAEGGIR